MSRRTENLAGNYAKNPTTLYLEWSSNDKCFRYYDKEAKENKLLPLPVKFVYLDERQTIGGWSDSNGCSIYANEVKFIGTETLTVKLSKGNETIVKGIYKDIKEKVVVSGGHYVRSIYVVLDGQLTNIKLKGSGTQAWGDFGQINKNKFGTNWIEVNDVVAGKKGSVKFSKPLFSLGAELTESEASLADVVGDSLFDFFDAKGANNTPNDSNEDIHASVEENTAVPVAVGDDDDLPF